MSSGFKSREPLAKEGYRLVGAAMEVYNEIGFGLLEPVFQEEMERELSIQSIPFDSQRELTLTYKGEPMSKRYIPDLFVFESIVVELKAAKEMLPEFEAQLINDMRITKSPIGYLLNFGKPDGLDWKRFLFSEYLT